MLRKTMLILSALLLLCAACACSQPDNRPYEPDTPEPAAHSGVFVSEHGKMTFSGDGESVVIDFDDYLAALTGLPAGESEASYVFLSGDLPPHGSLPVRYDTAHELKVTAGEASVVIELSILDEEGTAHGGVDTVTPERIPMLFRSGGGSENIIFVKENGGQ